ncbi:hypothetical protein [Pseudomonas aeruginosa]|uniref:hypothetical protein n=1 Tax=Pseudomonas aeruginosa TaxID=287 RepID=UPI00111305CA|nr:hypothetical protein [Pseudomonas aeruginosa]
MASYDSTQALDLLGKTVSVVEHSGPFTTSATGVVTAVVVALPGSSVSASIFVGDDYFDLDESVVSIH